MSEERPLPDPDGPQFWPQLVKWQTREAQEAGNRGFPAHAQQWRDQRGETVQHWADAEVARAAPSRLPDGASRRGRKGH